ncbi:MAG: hypothetical protein PHH77_10445 [Victivallaceae bacterium]|nr:hypothetical protein [Victivallaceae bacterium]
MTDGGKMRRRMRWIAAAVVTGVFILGIRDALFRELWFDEALTVGQFMELPTVGAVYRNYTIPNNHIIYTVGLKLWNYFTPAWLAPDCYWRLFTVLTAAAAVGIIFGRWRKRYGTMATALVLSALCCSLPFEIYATAVRGYMLSMLWIVLALECARNWVFGSDWRAGTGYFLFCLAAVGTIPSNLLALAGIVIFFFPYFGFRKIFDWKFVYLALIPLTATVLFYLPLSRNVARILKSHEGWDCPAAVLRAVYSGFALAFLPVALASLAGGVIYLRRKGKPKFLWPLLILLFPLPAVLLRSPAPFPRVFLALWPLWMLLLAAGLRHLMAGLRTLPRQLLAGGILLAATAGWGTACHHYRAPAAEVFHGNGNLDDFFNPYYMHSEYHPWNLVQKIKTAAGNRPIPVYVSFNAEPYVIVLYGRMAGISPARWRFDNPRGKVAGLPPGAWILLKTEELKRGEPENIRARFGIKALEPMFTEGVYTVFQTGN